MIVLAWILGSVVGLVLLLIIGSIVLWRLSPDGREWARVNDEMDRRAKRARQGIYDDVYQRTRDDMKRKGEL